MTSPLDRKYGKTAQKILDCATQLFSEKGYDGTIMDTLSETCQVNKASIYYHFNDKATLYEICMTRLFHQVVETVIQQIHPHDTPQEQLRCWIQSFAYAAHQQAQMPAALMREIASGGKNMPVAARQQMQRLLQKLTEILVLGQQQQVFTAADPLMIHFMIIGGFSFHITSEPMRNAIHSQRRMDPTLDEAVVQVTKLILNALTLGETP